MAMETAEEMHRRHGSNADAATEEEDDVNCHVDSSQQSDSSSNEDSLSSRHANANDSSSNFDSDDDDDETDYSNDDDSYYSSERSYNDSSSSSSSGDIDSRSDTSSYHESERSCRRSSATSIHSELATTATPTLHHSNTSSSTNTSTSTKRTFHRGVLPILSHGLLGGDNNCDPNRKNTLIQRRGKSATTTERIVESNNDKVLHHQSPTEPQRNQKANNNGDDRIKRSRRRRLHDRSRYDDCKTWKNTTPTTIHYCIKYLCCQTKKRSTNILVFAFVMWILAQCCYFYFWSWKKDIFNAILVWDSNNRYHHQQRNRGMSGRERKVLLYQSDPINHRNLYQPHSPEERAMLREQLMKEAKEVLGTAAGNDDDFDPNYYQRDNGGKPNKLNNRRHRKKSRDSDGSSRTERIREGCASLEWHSFHFPNCNEIHEINLRNVVRRRRFTSTTKNYSVNNSTSTAGVVEPVLPWGFVGNGLWRDVFSCDPREEAVPGMSSFSNSASSLLPQAPAVLKVMKSEHPYDQRNFQRHRRDALVMERLSFSHHVVPIYGYCGYSVLTQAISHTLDDVIFSRENESVKKWTPERGFVTKPPLESWMGRDDDGELVATRETEIGRIRLALGVYRGLSDLHEGNADKESSSNTTEWLPIIHADLQAKQYLIDSATGHIYLNDFNRCRFITKVDPPTNSSSTTINATSNETGSAGLESCPVYIPSAPGIARSPEEYDMTALSEKLDIYSSGNILYEIITGKRIWDEQRNKNTRAAIQRGERPQVNDTVRNAIGTVDAELTRLLDRVYDHDPKKRPSAKEVVVQLESLLDREMKRKRDNNYAEEEHHRRELKLRRRL